MNNLTSYLEGIRATGSPIPLPIQATERLMVVKNKLEIPMTESSSYYLGLADGQENLWRKP